MVFEVKMKRVESSSIYAIGFSGYSKNNILFVQFKSNKNKIYLYFGVHEHEYHELMSHKTSKGNYISTTIKKNYNCISLNKRTIK